MNRNNLWKFLFTVFVVTWCLYSMYPPTGHDLIEYFDAQEKIGLHYTGLVEMIANAMTDIEKKTKQNYQRSTRS